MSWNYRARAHAAGRRHIRELNREAEALNSPAPQPSVIPSPVDQAASENSRPGNSEGGER